MSRSPLAYPLNRGADMDVGGAADLQTDVMRFMAIISLCLVAIFALVQSMPVTPPTPPNTPVAMTPAPEAPPESVPEPAVTIPKVEKPVVEKVEATVSLTRPKSMPKHQPKAEQKNEPVATPVVVEAPPPATPLAAASVAAAVVPVEEQQGFTLQFESDAALTRLVAAGQVGVYAIDASSARRMTVSESRISFWDASLPNSFHEMDVSTVPRPVIDALARSDTDLSGVSWGVTLPGKLKSQLDGLMQKQDGGSLLIGINGQIRLED